MKIGEKFLIFEQAGEICVEEKKHFFDWKTISGYNVNPHKAMKKNSDACEFCPF